MSTTASASDLTVRGLLATEPQMAGDKNHVLRFSIRKNSRRQRSHPTYVNCKAFGDTADQLHKTLAKATPWDTLVELSGELVEEQWEQNGQSRRAMYVYVDQASIVRAARSA